MLYGELAQADCHVPPLLFGGRSSITGHVSWIEASKHLRMLIYHQAFSAQQIKILVSING